MHSLNARIYEFLSGCGGGDILTARKQPGQRFFFLLLVLNLFYSLQRWSNGFITEKTILFKGSRGFTFSRGGGGSSVQVLISIETHITCDFPGGDPDPLSSPLDPHMVSLPDNSTSLHV